MIQRIGLTRCAVLLDERYRDREQGSDYERRKLTE